MNTPAPVASVVIPVHNGEEYLRECLDSVLAQTLHGIEVICVDDGSTDSTPVILAEYAARDSRVSVLRREHSGAGESRNAGMDAASGEYLAFLDADDVFANDFLERMVSKLDETGADVSVCRYSSFRDGSPVPSFSADGVKWRIVENPSSYIDVFSRWVGWAWDKVFRRSFVLRHALRFQNIPAVNDLAFVYSALSLAERVADFSGVLVAHRYHGGSIETRRDRFPLCCADALRAYRDKMLSCGRMDDMSPLCQAFRRYVSRFVFIYLCAMWDEDSYRQLKAALPELAREFGVAGSWSWRKYGFLCRVKRPVKLLLRRMRR